MKLTEDIVFQRLRNCASSLDTITKINITGRDLDDISLLRKMTSIEVLSLSVNKISTLADLQGCKYLKELYLRKNNITDLNEIYYIKNLPYLTILGLSQNPCSNLPYYRMTLIRNLPKLEKLDDISIMAEERVEALRKGLAVVNPEEAAELLMRYMEERPPSDDTMATAIPEAKVEESGMNGHHPSKLKVPSNTVNQCLRMDATSPEVATVPDRPTSVTGVCHSNLLPGILVLVTDLDYCSLEILSLNIKNRLNEFHMNGSSKQ